VKPVRVLGAAVGLAALVAALVVGEGLPVDPLVNVLGSDYFVVAALAGAAVVVAGSVVVSGRSANLEQADTPDPERPTSAPPAGSALEAGRTAAGTLVPVVGRSRRNRIHDRMRLLVVETLVRSGGCDRTAAEQRVDSGAWTDDSLVASYVSEGRWLTPRAWLAALVRGRHPYGHLVARTYREVESLNGGSR
jgi:hypothetical protein